MKNKILTLIILVIIYFLLKYIIPFGGIITYPINILVTFMHEFGHSFFAIITGGEVKSIQINGDGSGYATTAGGIRDFVISGGYLGSAIFGNLLLYIGFKKEKLSENILYFISALIIFVAVFWFNSILSSGILFILAGGLFALAKYTKYDSLVLQFLGISSIIFIIEDFNVGPSSDLEKFSSFLPSSVWMVVWLILVIAITGYNLKLIFKKK